MKKINKKPYSKPKLEKIKIDKNISMVMMSTPPGDPAGMSYTGIKIPFFRKLLE